SRSSPAPRWAHNETGITSAKANTATPALTPTVDMPPCGPLPPSRASCPSQPVLPFTVRLKADTTYLGARSNVSSVRLYSRTVSRLRSLGHRLRTAAGQGRRVAAVRLALEQIVDGGISVD